MDREKGTVFFSFNQVDRHWVKRLETMLAPMVQQGRLFAWSGADIGDNTAAAEREAFEQARVVVLFVCSDYLARDYQKIEQRLLARWQKKEVTIIWFKTAQCVDEETSLHRVQSAGNTPLNQLAGDQVGEELKRLAKTIAAKVKRPSTGNVTQNLRKVPPPEPKRSYGLAAMVGTCLVLGLFAANRLVFTTRSLPEHESHSITQSPDKTTLFLGPAPSAPLAENSGRYHKHWPWGRLQAEHFKYRNTYVLGYPEQGRLPRWVAYEVKPGAYKMQGKNDKRLPDLGYNFDLEGYLRATLVFPSLVGGGGRQASSEVSFNSLKVPMSPLLHGSWRVLGKKAKAYTHIIAGPFVNESLRSLQGILIPNRYFIVMVREDEKAAYWLDNQTGACVETDVADIAQQTGLNIFDR